MDDYLDLEECNAPEPNACAKVKIINEKLNHWISKKSLIKGKKLYGTNVDRPEEFMDETSGFQCMCPMLLQ